MRSTKKALMLFVLALMACFSAQAATVKSTITISDPEGLNGSIWWLLDEFPTPVLTEGLGFLVNTVVLSDLSEDPIGSQVGYFAELDLGEENPSNGLLLFVDNGAVLFGSEVALFTGEAETPRLKTGTFVLTLINLDDLNGAHGNPLAAAEGPSIVLVASAVPEPGSMALGGLGLAGLWLLNRRRSD